METQGQSFQHWSIFHMNQMNFTPSPALPFQKGEQKPRDSNGTSTVLKSGRKPDRSFSAQAAARTN